MQYRTYEEHLRAYLETLPIQTLRILGRRQGVPKKNLAKKALIIQSIADIFTGRAEPDIQTNRGAPVKNDYLDPEIMSRLFNIRREHDDDWDKEIESPILEVASPDAKKRPPVKPISTGLVEMQPNGTGILHKKYGKISRADDCLLPPALIQTYEIRNGDYISCHIQDTAAGEALTVERVLSINEQVVGQFQSRAQFERLTPDYPRDKIELSANCNSAALRMIDLFAPIGRGQRALIVAPPHTGNTTLLREISCAIIDHHSSAIQLIVLLLDARPEDVTEFNREVGYYALDLLYSTFDEGAEEHIRVAQLAIEHAKRYAEQGRNVMLLCDSLTKLDRAYRSFMSSQEAEIGVKQFFGSARNTLEEGSITMLATVGTDENGTERSLYLQLKDACNAEIVLSEELARDGIFPAVDLKKSGTRKQSMLLSEDEIAAANAIRSESKSTQTLLKHMKRTKNNQDLVAQILSKA